MERHFDPVLRRGLSLYGLNTNHFNEVKLIQIKTKIKIMCRTNKKGSKAEISHPQDETKDTTA